jgi:hypothetical protein
VIAHPTQDRPILSRLPTGSDLRQGQDKEPTVVVGEPNAAMHLTPQNDQLMSSAAFSASSRLFDLKGEAKTDRRKQNNPNIVLPTLGDSVS